MSNAGAATEVPELTGYADRLSVEPGESVRFMVSTDQLAYRSSLVRLVHGDENPAGPGLKVEPVTTVTPRVYSGRLQRAVSGSYVAVPAPSDCPSFTLQAWIFPTAPQSSSLQGLLGKWSEDPTTGYRLVIQPEGDLSLWIGQVSGGAARLRTGVPLHESYWYFVAAALDADSGQASIHQVSLSSWLLDGDAAVQQPVGAARTCAEGSPFLIGAAALGQAEGNGRPSPLGPYNGKVDSPRLFSRRLDVLELDRLRHDENPQKVAPDALIAAWDFAAEPESVRVYDSGPLRLHGEAVNLPTRAVTSHAWTGKHFDYSHAQKEYAAIHFHADDLEDAGWEADFEVRVPEDARSGVYAAQLEVDGATDHIPFFVRPRRGRTSARALLLMPTMTYLAYANERIDDWAGMGGFPESVARDPRDAYLARHPELGRSTYDIHIDGSGVCHSSYLRPIPNLRPNYRWWLTAGPERLPADLYLVDWLEHEGFAYDLVTDHDLHRERVELLSHYRVLLTPTHPEYWTAPMLASLEGYLEGGGRLMYLGGNGFYCVTGVHLERPHVIEVRRANGSRTWGCEPGEEYLATTGERGGLWRFRGAPPNRLVGSGFAAQDNSASKAAAYHRLPDSFDPRVAFIFEGIADDEVIGDFGLLNGGAAGYEVDRLDHTLGSPPHALLLATSSGEHTPGYLVVVEDLLSTEPDLDGPLNPNVRADMVFMEGPNGGAVFSVGSINWCGSLSHDGYQNNVSKITANVLRAFLAHELPAGRGGLPT